ncbi:formylglycine-generating enzyme family protein [Nostoc sp. UHCC 0252]|uniref:formylglycine-generating enzyme family protein n=1 Tax=Nostoc sp. UHCC 0252 TaxID=3110241 RepID=UPI002B1F2E43|nr:SUMF1/EgtB/PvdO family nonheme iron enzyme [Nostoc sp. UHCC 0252]MEA5602767.1 SUMF1/EgtB/PvdO family nonheme iron enzyme [Nostoc sp. UHCC 0252]
MRLLAIAFPESDRRGISAPTDGTAWIVNGNSEKRICRGGSWSNSPADCRAAVRRYNSPAFRFNLIGFRVVCSVFPALFHCQNWTMGIVRAYPEESRPVPATEITLSENKTRSDSLVGASRTVVRPISLQMRFKSWRIE